MSHKFLNPVEVDGQVSAEYLDLSTTTTHSVNAGEIAWNSVDGTFDIGLLNGVTLQAGQEIHFYGKATEAISNGDAVQFAGVQGDHLLIKKAVASEINANPEYFMGVATQDFSNNQFGYVTAFGNVRELDTTSYNLGEVLYFNSESLSVPGLLTSTKPTAPNAKIEVAAVVRVHGTQGILMVRPHVMPKVSDIQDVYIDTGTLTQNSGIFWNQLNSRFENKSIADALGYTPANASGTSSYLSKFTSPTTLGNSQVFDNGTNVLIGTTTDGGYAKLVISGGNVLIDNNTNFVTKRADGLVLSMLKVNTSNQLEFNPLYGQGVTGYIFGINGASKMSMNTSGDVTAISSFRTPTFYDSDNTSYYLNAAGSSNLYDVTANKFVKSGGTSSQFLKADGTVDSNTYLTSVTNISGYSGTLISEDNRIISPSELAANRLKFGFTSWDNNNNSPYADFIHLRSYQDSSGGSDNLVMFKKSGIGMRIWQQTYGTTTAYSTFKDVAFTDSDISGNAATATTLQTTRTINGTNFNGSANIETSYWGATRTLTIGNTGKTVNGSGNQSWSLAEIGAYPSTNPNSYTSNTGTVTSVSGTGSYGGLTLSGTVTGSGNITLGGTPTGTWPISISGNADTVDGYHSSGLWRSDGGTWNPGANITLGQTANNQEWSFDITRNGYTGGYWHVWDSSNSTMLKVDAVTGKVSAPYNFVGNLEGNATTATTATSADNIDGIAFRNGNSSNSINPDSITENGIGYVNSVSLFGQTDGALYSQAYSSVWNHHIFGDYRTGQLAVRGRNNGTLTAWRTVLDSSNFTSYAASTSHTHTFNSLTSKTLGTGTYQTSGDFRAPIFYDSNNTSYYVDPASTSNINNLVVTGTITGNITGNADHLRTSYIGGQQLNPQTYFNSATGLKVAMTAVAGVWSDTLWINGYAGGDVPSMCALHTKRDGTPRMYISTQASNATSYGTLYEILSNYGGTGTYSTTGDFRAPIFYDSNNTGYYLDPSSTSNLYGLTVGNTITGSITGNSGTVSNITNNTGLVRNGLSAPGFIDGLTTTNFRTTLFGSTTNGYQISTARWNNVPAPLSGLNQYSTMIAWAGSDTQGFLAVDYNSPAAIIGGGNANNINWSRRVLIENVWTNSKYFGSDGAIYGTIFYDSNNTAYFFDGASTGDSIRCAGDIVAYYSDERLKDKKGNIQNALEKVLSLNGFYYEPNDKAQELGYKKKLEVGVSAQEVEAILPEIIKDAPIGQGYKTLDYGKLTPLLIEAVKEQQKQIDELKELVNKLITK